jgi:hypothetical protein
MWCEEGEYEDISVKGFSLVGKRNLSYRPEQTLITCWFQDPVYTIRTASALVMNFTG